MARKRKNEIATDGVVDLSVVPGLTLMSDSTTSYVSDWVPTMIPEFDHLMGGGIPWNRVIEIYGLNQSGKSTLAIHLTKRNQQSGVATVWVDIEGTVQKDTLTGMGVDLKDNVYMIAPEDGEIITIEAVTKRMKQIIETFSKANKRVMVIWDTLAATATDMEMGDNYNPNMMGTKAKAISYMTTQIGQSINNSTVSFVILNQARDDLKARSMPGFPTPIKSTGGKAMEHWATIRLEVKKASQIKEKVYDKTTGKTSDDYIGHIFRATLKKSKVSTPNRKKEMYLISEPYLGFDFEENIYRSSVDHFGFISTGAWRKYETNAGEEIKLRHTEWVPFLRSDEGKPILTELYIKQMLQLFPEGFVAFDNDNIDVTGNEHLAALKEAYKNKENVPKSVESTEETE